MYRLFFGQMNTPCCHRPIQDNRTFPSLQKVPFAIKSTPTHTDCCDSNHWSDFYHCRLSFTLFWNFIWVGSFSMYYCVQFLSVSIMSVIFIDTAVCISSLFLCGERESKVYSIGKRDHNLFICPLVDGLVCCFQFASVMSKAAMNICIQTFLWVYVFIFLGYCWVIL